MQIKSFKTTNGKQSHNEPVTIKINGETVIAQKGDLVSTVLHQLGITAFHQHPRTKRLTGVYCMMGVCYQCLVTIDGMDNCRACQTFIHEGMQIETVGKQKHA